MNRGEEAICYIRSDAEGKMQEGLFHSSNTIELPNAVAANGLVMLSGELDSSIGESLTISGFQKQGIVESNFHVMRTEEMISRGVNNRKVSHCLVFLMLH